MEFEINSRMKWKTVDAKLNEAFRVTLALAFEGKGYWNGDDTLAQISPKPNGRLLVSGNMTVGEFCKKMSEQFGGSASIWVSRNEYKGRSLLWYSGVDDDVKLKDASTHPNNTFKHTIEFFSFDQKNEKQAQVYLAHKEIEDTLKKEFSDKEFLNFQKEVDRINKTKTDFNLINIDEEYQQVIEHLKEEAKKQFEFLKERIIQSGKITESNKRQLQDCIAINEELNDDHLYVHIETQIQDRKVYEETQIQDQKVHEDINALLRKKFSSVYLLNFREEVKKLDEIKRSCTLINIDKEYQQVINHLKQEAKEQFEFLKKKITKQKELTKLDKQQLQDCIFINEELDDSSFLEFMEELQKDTVDKIIYEILHKRFYQYGNLLYFREEVNKLQQLKKDMNYINIDKDYQKVIEHLKKEAKKQFEFLKKKIIQSGEFREVDKQHLQDCIFINKELNEESLYAFLEEKTARQKKKKIIMRIVSPFIALLLLYLFFHFLPDLINLLLK